MHDPHLFEKLVVSDFECSVVKTAFPDSTNPIKLSEESLGCVFEFGRRDGLQDRSQEFLFLKSVRKNIHCIGLEGRLRRLSHYLLWHNNLDAKKRI